MSRADDREFLPSTMEHPIFGTMPCWVPNPNFTGHKYPETFTPYPVRLLRGRFGYGPARKGAKAFVERAPSGELRLIMEKGGSIFHSNAKEGIDYEDINEGVKR